ncbi:MAG: DUF3261 domain-containing protein [Deltaproteobacteria bacterium]|nr:DUF3261 domain-containing protein [Deltaproteobacteria bacterium]
MKLLLGLLFCLLSGCSLLPSLRAPVAPVVPHYPLLAPATFGGSYAAQHLLEGHAQGHDFTLQLQVEIEPEHIVLVGFTPWQTRAFVLRYDGTTVTFENFTLREMPFPPERMLSDLQLVLWPHFPDLSDWHVTRDPQTHERLVSFQDQLITRIRYQGAPLMPSVVELENIVVGYRLRIQIREAEDRTGESETGRIGE